MKVNWKVRFKNKVWLTSFFAAILTFLYTVLGLFDVAPEVTRNEAGEMVNSVLMIMSLMGVIMDPTTAGLYDSNRAMTYEEPHDDDAQDEEPDQESAGEESTPEKTEVDE